MKKDKAWLKEEVFELYPSHDVMYVSPDYEAVAKTETISKVLELIEQLDEPEKPVIPQFVAKHIEASKKIGDRLNVALSKSPETGMVKKMNVTISEANNIYARAWLDGYEVEKEKLYHVVNKQNYFLLRKYDDLVDILHVLTSMTRDKYGKDTRFMLTEQEIKDYDERFWVFAEEVTE